MPVVIHYDAHNAASTAQSGDKVQNPNTACLGAFLRDISHLSPFCGTSHNRAYRKLPLKSIKKSPQKNLS